MKDFYDEESLARAIVATFRRRGTTLELETIGLNESVLR